MNLITKHDTSARRIAAVGMYDGVHLGHRFLIDYLGVEARSRGLVPAVVTFSRHPLTLVRPLQAPALLNTLEERVTMIGEAGARDVILLSFNDSLRHMSAEEFLRELKGKFGIEALVLGFNNRFGHDRMESMDQYRAVGEKVGVEVIPAPEYRGEASPVSSSIIRRYLSEGHPEDATRALGRPYALRGRVINGKRLGRTLGFPTANLSMPDYQALIPKTGVYAAYVTTPDGVRRKAVVNVGYRPTVDSPEASADYRHAGTSASGTGSALSIEAHILDFVGYIYDEEIKVEFMKYIRPERRFADTTKLSAQVKDDIATARKGLS